jgi:hypothetical protein
VNDAVVATAQTDGTGTARPPTTAYNTGFTLPGHYPGAVRVRLGEEAGFFIADNGSADLTILRAFPVITWLPPAPVFYGTPLGGPQLNAAADVAGQFTYAPASGTILHVGENQGLTTTFVPADLQQFEEVSATNYLTVLAAPLSVAVTPTSKLYLDPLPPFGVTYTGFVNGDGPSAVVGSPSFQTSATAASSVGVYPVSISGLTARDYMLTTSPGVLTIAPRPTATTVQLSGPNPATYGQSTSITVVVSSGIGTPNGNVTVLDAAVPVATAALVNAQVTFSLASWSAGSHSLSVQYSGDSGFAPSTSPAVTQSVLTARTTIELTSSVNPSRTGEAIVLSAAVRPVAPGGGVPMGSVEFIRGGTIIATAPLNSGTALFTISSLPVGKHQLQARYVGSPDHAASASVVLQQTVKGGK